MKTLNISITWNDTDKLVLVHAQATGLIPELPDRVISGTGQKNDGDPLLDPAYRAITSAISLAMTEIEGGREKFAQAADNLDQARELLGLPADYGKKWMAFVKTSGMPAYWFATVEVADAFMAADPFNAANYVLEEGVPPANLPEWVVPPVIINIGEEYTGSKEPGAEYDPDLWVAVWRFASEGDGSIWEAEDPENRRLGTATGTVDLQLWTPPPPQVWVGYLAKTAHLVTPDGGSGMLAQGDPIWWFRTQDQAERWVENDPVHRYQRQEVPPANLPRFVEYD